MNIRKLLYVCVRISCFVWLSCLHADAIYSVKPVESSEELAKGYFKRARDLEMGQEVAKLCTQAIALKPNYAEAYALRGRARGLSLEAFDDFDKAIKLKPDLRVTYVYRGKLKSTFGKHREAIKDFDKAIALDSTDGWVFFSRAISYGALKDKTNTLASIKAMVRRNMRTDILVRDYYSFSWLRGDSDFEALMK